MPNNFLDQLSQIDDFLESRTTREQQRGINPQRQAARDETDLATADAARSLISSSRQPVSTLSDRSLFPGAEARAAAAPDTVPIRGLGGKVLGQRVNEEKVLATMLASTRAPASLEEIRQKQEERLAQGIESARGLIDQLRPETGTEEGTFLKLAEIAGDLEKEGLRNIGDQDPVAQQKRLLELQKMKLDIAGSALDLEGKKKGSKAGGSADTKLLKELSDMEVTLGSLTDVAGNLDVEAFTLAGRIETGIAKAADFANLSTDQQKQLINRRRIQTEKIEQFFNAYRKLITGAQASVKELEMLRASVLNKNLGPTELKASLKNAIVNFRLDMQVKRNLIARRIVPEGTEDPIYSLKFEQEKARIRKNLHRLYSEQVDREFPALRVAGGETQADENIKQFVKQNESAIRKAIVARRARK